MNKILILVALVVLVAVSVSAKIELQRGGGYRSRQSNYNKPNKPKDDPKTSCCEGGKNFYKKFNGDCDGETPCGSPLAALGGDMLERSLPETTVPSISPTAKVFDKFVPVENVTCWGLGCGCCDEVKVTYSHKYTYKGCYNDTGIAEDPQAVSTFAQCSTLCKSRGFTQFGLFLSEPDPDELQMCGCSNGPTLTTAALLDDNMCNSDIIGSGTNITLALYDINTEPSQNPERSEPAICCDGRSGTNTWKFLTTKDGLFNGGIDGLFDGTLECLPKERCCLKEDGKREHKKKHDYYSDSFESSGN